MTLRKITYRLCVYSTDAEQEDYQVDAATPFPTFQIGDLVKSGVVAGFAADQFHGKVGRILHFLYGANEETFVCQTSIWLAKSDWWDTGEHQKPLEEASGTSIYEKRGLADLG